MPLINFEVNLILTWSSTCVLISTNIPNQNATKSGFKRVINWNKNLSKPELLAQNPKS